MTASIQTAMSRSALAAEPPASNPHGWQATSQGLMLDLDGTLIRGSEIVPGAQTLLRQWKSRYVIVSNNSSDTSQTLARRLQAMDLPVEPQEIILAGVLAVDHIVSRYLGMRVLMCASAALLDYAAGRGVRLVDHDAQVVLLARDTGFGYKTLSRISEELHRGAKLVVSNGDLTHPGPGGVPVPETGALLRAVLACNTHALPQIIGKPESQLYLHGLRQLSLAPHQVTMIGDNLATDALGACRLGMPYLLVGSAPQADACDIAHLLERDCAVRRTLPHDVQARD